MKNMFKSILANEMKSYLEIRALNVSKGSASQDRQALAALDQYLDACDFQKTELTEEALSVWISSLPGKSKTVSEKVGSVMCGFRHFPEKVKQ